MKKIENINCGVYGIYNSKNQPLYIGSSNDLNQRYNSHYREIINKTHYNSLLLYFSDLFGLSNLIFKTIMLCDEDDLIFQEKFFIKLLNPICNKQFSEMNYVNTKIKHYINKYDDDEYNKIKDYIKHIDKSKKLRTSDISKELNVSTKKIATILKLNNYKLHNGTEGRIWFCN